MPPQQQSSAGNDPGASDFLWITIVLVGGFFLAWYFGQKYIAHFIYQIRLYEIHAIQFVIVGWNVLVDKMHLSLLALPVKHLQNMAMVIQRGEVGISLESLQMMSAQVGTYFCVVTAPLLFIFATIIYTTNIHLKFRKTFGLKQLKFAEKENWPQITPVLKLDLVNTDIDKGPWAMSMTPMQFCKFHHILKEHTDDWGKKTVTLIQDKAYEIFSVQLGPLWTHISALPPHAKAIFAALAACGNHDRKVAFELLNNIAVSSQNNTVDFSGTDELLMKYFNTKLVIRVLQHHAYVTTVFIAMLELARTDGVFATSEFLWLKPLDRKLWYVLNTVGRYTAVPEAAGPHAHFLSEKKWGGPLRTPMMEEAVRAMEVALSEILYDPEDEV